MATQEVRSRKQGIDLLCQWCFTGAMVPLHRTLNSGPLFRCDHCKKVQLYGSAGWVSFGKGE
jgi:hypothetical protein